ncbi:MAG: DUF4331 domain-containing protein [Rhodocyclaceae bacterium]|nr:DUF4331 domain-containing protein [Rhodocyclaceae bacterium]
MTRTHLSTPWFRPAALALATATALAAGGAQASSHREAPFISTMPKVDATDFYLFRSYEAGRGDYVTLIANYQPLQDAYGGPNYFSMDPDAVYEIHVDNNGDAVEDISFQFRFDNALQDIALSIGDRQVSIPLIQAGGLSGVNPAALNLRETYTIDVVQGDRRAGSRQRMTPTGGGERFDKPVDNIGDKTFGGAGQYAGYAMQHVHDATMPDCAAPARVFVGQRKDPFAVNLGRVFDLVNLDPLGAPDGSPNTIDDKNVTTLALEVPIDCLRGADPVIGAWTTASLRQGRLLDGNPGSGHKASDRNGGAWVQVSRLGMPLVNEVVIGLKDKDAFNAGQPMDDGRFADYVTHPTLPALLEILFSVPAPTNFPRTDLVAAFLTGLEGINQPANVTASEMLRLNTSTPATESGSQSNLGVLGGDSAGFPNGRRPGDDVVDVALRVVMGALCTATGDTDALKVGCAPGDAPVGDAPLTDGVLQQASQFDASFPYLTTPIPGAP